MIKAITFDLWNTLFQDRFYNEERTKILLDFLKKRNIKIAEKTIKLAFEKAFYLKDLSLQGDGYKHIHARERVEKLFEYLKIDKRSEEVDLITDKYETIMLSDPPELKKGVKRTLSTLSDKYKLGLISNTGVTPGRVIEKVLSDYNIRKYFHITIYSDEVGFFKPHRKLFELALENLNVNPSEALHIGDILETDIKGAKEIGMKAIWIKDHGIEEFDDIIPDYSVYDIDEILPIFKELNKEDKLL